MQQQLWKNADDCTICVRPRVHIDLVNFTDRAYWS